MKPRAQKLVRLALALSALALNTSVVQPAHAACWVTNGPMTSVRQNHTATLLPNGKLLATTNLSVPLSSWTALSGITAVAPGQFQFTDARATNSPQRFYRVRSP
jgi:hypothetical protein